MTPSSGIITKIEDHLSETITGSGFVSGGSINIAYSLQTERSKYFLKVNHKTLYPGMFAAEAKGLALLAQTNTVKLPVIVFTSSQLEEDIQKAYRLAANSYLVKPLGFSALMDTIKLIDAYWLKLSCLPVLSESPQRKAV